MTPEEIRALPARIRAPKERPEVQPRGLSREQAATYCGLTPSNFARKVDAGDLPKPIPWAGRVKTWDRAALDRALDKLSHISAGEPGDEWMKALHGEDRQKVRAGR